VLDTEEHAILIGALRDALAKVVPKQMLQTALRVGIVAATFLASWLSGGAAYLFAAGATFNRPVGASGLYLLAASTIVMLVALYPWLQAMVSTVLVGGGSRLARTVRGFTYGGLIVVLAGALVSALLGRGRVEDVASVAGALTLVWFSVSVAVWGVAGVVLSSLGLWPSAQDAGGESGASDSGG